MPLAVAVHKIEITLRADLSGGDLRIHVADHQIRNAYVVADDLPNRFVGLSLVDDFDRLELQPLGIGVDRIDNAAASRRVCADVQMVRGRDREADQIVAIEHRHAERHVGTVRRPAIGIVVHDDVAGAEHVAAGRKPLADAADIAGDRTGLQWRRHLAFAQLPPFGVGQGGAEILRLADDARIAHAHKLVAHFDGDVLQRALDDGAGDRIDSRRRLRAAVGQARLVHRPPLQTFRMRLPAASLMALQPGGMTVVESFCSTMAGPANDFPTGKRWRR